MAQQPDQRHIPEQHHPRHPGHAHGQPPAGHGGVAQHTEQAGIEDRQLGIQAARQQALGKSPPPRTAPASLGLRQRQFTSRQQRLGANPDEPGAARQPQQLPADTSGRGQQAQGQQHQQHAQQIGQGDTRRYTVGMAHPLDQPGAQQQEEIRPRRQQGGEMGAGDQQEQRKHDVDPP
ncbi:hypothetical protein FQZ97_1058860 [compost metagenome]